MTRRIAAAVALVLLGAGGCEAAGREEILVFAAASLSGPFTEIGSAFERVRSGTVVRFSFGPSSGLATAVNEGAPADVFASADPRWMDEVAVGAGVTDRAVFARNRLVVVVPRDDPALVRVPADIARPGVKLVVAAPEVPAGAYAREMLDDAGMSAALRNVVSNEEDVKAVLQKVILGEADAGIVYATDVTPELEGSVRSIAIPDDVNVVASYPIAVVRGSEHTAAARAFVSFVLGDGRAILAAAGFDP